MGSKNLDISHRAEVEDIDGGLKDAGFAQSINTNATGGKGPLPVPQPHHRGARGTHTIREGGRRAPLTHMGPMYVYTYMYVHITPCHEPSEAEKALPAAFTRAHDDTRIKKTAAQRMVELDGETASTMMMTPVRRRGESMHTRKDRSG